MRRAAVSCRPRQWEGCVGGAVRCGSDEVCFFFFVFLFKCYREMELVKGKSTGFGAWMPALLTDRDTKIAPLTGHGAHHMWASLGSDAGTLLPSWKVDWAATLLA